MICVCVDLPFKGYHPRRAELYSRRLRPLSSDSFPVRMRCQPLDNRWRSSSLASWCLGDRWRTQWLPTSWRTCHRQLSRKLCELGAHTAHWLGESELLSRRSINRSRRGIVWQYHWHSLPQTSAVQGSLHLHRWLDCSVLLQPIIPIDSAAQLATIRLAMALKRVSDLCQSLPAVLSSADQRP